jgi:hypothetical protein
MAQDGREWEGEKEGEEEGKGKEKGCFSLQFKMSRGLSNIPESLFSGCLLPQETYELGQ